MTQQLLKIIKINESEVIYVMYNYTKLNNLNDYFINYSKRPGKGVFFCRISGYNTNIRNFIIKYIESAKKNGILIEEKISNPNEQNLSYYTEIMGTDFILDIEFIEKKLKKWLNHLNDIQALNIANAIYNILDEMKNQNKNDNMLKNAYIKFMCWLYYKFDIILSSLGNEQLPKILYSGNINKYELLILSILSHAGCDIVLINYNEYEYKKIDNKNKLSYHYEENEMTEFPNSFSLKQINNEIIKTQKYADLKPEISVYTNSYITGEPFFDILKNPFERGYEPDFCYNCFMKIIGANDRLTYLNELFSFYTKLKENKRNIVIEDKFLPIPNIDEINKIKRRNYKDFEHMIFDISQNIYLSNITNTARQRFIEIFKEEKLNKDENLNRLMNKAVYILCWFNRYKDKLFKNYRKKDISVFIFFGGCKNKNESLFMKFLAGLPVDVLILVPDLNSKCTLEDKLLFEKKYTESLNVDTFPKDETNIKIGTAAYHAEQDLNNTLYKDTGLYKNKQYKKAAALTLKTMYEEIEILWNQDAKYRPNFITTDEKVIIPVILAKALGVKNISDYWKDIKKLITDNTYLINKAPYINTNEFNPIIQYAHLFFKNGRLIKDKIKNHNCYKYLHIREEMQDYILEKLELLINKKIIKGTFENGMEYKIISVILNLDNEILKLIQKYDFTKSIPKVIFINTTEKMYSLEDSIITAFLNLIGFDILFFTPTGYRNIEQFFTENMIEQHQIGDYVYDMQIPDFNNINIKSERHLSWIDKLLGKG